VVDGGRGQLGIALAVLTDLAIENMPVVGLAKEKLNVMGDELVDRVYVPGRKNPVELRSAGRALLLLAQARDEAHRVSNALRVRLGRGQRLRTRLDDIRGVGKKTAMLLLRKLGSLEAISAASLDDLVAAGVTSKQAKAILDHVQTASPDAVVSEDAALENAFAGDEPVAAEDVGVALPATVESTAAPDSVSDDGHAP